MLHSLVRSMRVRSPGVVAAFSVCAVLLPLRLLAANTPAPAPVELKTDADRASYVLGLEMARNFRKAQSELVPDMALRGMQDGLADRPPALSEREYRKVLSDVQESMRQRMTLNRHAQGFENRKQAAVFLADNKAKSGIESLANGVQYAVLRAGSGARPGAGDTVVINYRGTLLDGSQFDATEPGHPGTVKLPDLMLGLRSAIAAMPRGSSWRVWVPPHLGYGERGVGNTVGPNELLVFDVDLVDIRPPQ